MARSSYRWNVLAPSDERAPHASWASASLAGTLTITLLCICLLGAQTVFAPQVSAAPLPSLAKQVATSAHQQRTSRATAGLVTVIVLDMSGSMSVNDPDGLRCSAANAYIALSGPNDYIGVIGLDNSTGARGGPHNFQTAQVWAQPADMATLSARAHLEETITSDSHDCAPDAATPTYDALNQALSMLTAATAGNGRTGSVILLTDGTPDPDTTDQINAIQQELLPKFQQAHFPIDTIALGADQTFHPFLQNLSAATSGNFYDDSQGPVSGAPDALNIAPFFVDIFALRNHRTLGPTVAPTTLSGATDSQDLIVPSYVQHLDVIVVKDQVATRVTLTTPSGEVIPPAVAGVFVANDPHYAIFSIDGGSLGVQAGAWTINVTGEGRYLVDSLILSTLQLTITQPTSSVAALPLGQPFSITAALTANGATVIGTQYTIAGTLSFTGQTSNGAPYTIGLNFTQVSPGVYQVNVNIPQSAPPGVYRIAIDVTQVSGVPISSADRNIRLELFPTPLLLSGRPPAPTTSTVNATVTSWDPGLQFLYSLPLLSWLSGWPLGNQPPRPSAALEGEVTLHNQLYANATVAGVATRKGTNKSVPVQITDEGSGHFVLIFPAPVSGDYTITFQTQGTFADSHGDFGVTTRQVHLTVLPATPVQEVKAWFWTVVVYPFLAWLIYFLFIGRPLTPRPQGQWQRIPRDPSDSEATGDFKRARSRSILRWFLHPDWRTSREAFGDEDGAMLIFGRHTIKVRRNRRNHQFWRMLTGDPLPKKPLPTNGLNNDRSEYTFSSTGSGGKPSQGGSANSSLDADWGDPPVNIPSQKKKRHKKTNTEASPDSWSSWSV